jgi:hypothetical protein
VGSGDDADADDAQRRRVSPGTATSNDADCGGRRRTGGSMPPFFVLVLVRVTPEPGVMVQSRGCSVTPAQAMTTAVAVNGDGDGGCPLSTPSASRCALLLPFFLFLFSAFFFAFFHVFVMLLCRLPTSLYTR